MTTPRKEKSAAAPPTVVTELEGLLESMERRVEGLAARAQALAAENARLKGALGESVAQRDRLTVELEEAREGAALGARSAERLANLVAEREEIRGRIERLINSLEETDGALDPAEG